MGDQALERAPCVLPGQGSVARVSAFVREEKELAGEFLPGAARNAAPIAADGVHGRKNVMHREFKTHQSTDMPRAVGHNGDVPSFSRNAGLERENPRGFATAV